MPTSRMPSATLLNQMPPSQPLSVAFRLTVAIAIMGLASSCAIMLVGPYDAVTDQAITELASKTEIFFAKLSTRPGYAENKSFYVETKGTLQAIRLRAELYQKNQGELKAIDLLVQNINNLEELHRLGPLTTAVREPARALVETNFKALIQIELAKKRSSGVSST